MSSTVSEGLQRRQSSGTLYLGKHETKAAVPSPAVELSG